DWENYVYQVVKRYKNRIKYWEVWNEPYDLPAEYYFDLCKRTYTAAKKAWPEVQIAAPCGHRAQYWWLYNLNKLGLLDYCDIYTYHGYGTAATGSDALKQLASADGGNRLLWDSESGAGWGCQSFYEHLHFKKPGSKSPSVAAESVARILTSLYAGNTSRQFFYWNYSTYYFDGVAVSQGTTFEYDGSIRPVGVAHALCGYMLAGLKPAGSLNLGSARTAYLFTDGSVTLAILWDNHERNRQAELSLFDPNWAPAELREILKKADDIDTKRFYKEMSFVLVELPENTQTLDIMTNPMKLETKNGKFVAPLTSSPIYIKFPQKTPDEVRQIFAGCEVNNIGYDDVTVKPFIKEGAENGRPSLAIMLNNNTGKSLPVEIALSNVKGVRLAKYSDKTILEPFGSWRAAFPVSGKKMPMDISADYSISCEVLKEPLIGKFAKRILPAARFGKTPIIDGELNDWKLKKRTCISFDTGYLKEKSFPPEDISAQIWAGWDKTYFYIAAKVRDDKYLPAATDPASFWSQDCIEFFFDLDLEGDIMDTALSGDDFQVMTVASAEKQDGKPAAGPAATFPGIKIASKLLDDGYIVEYAFPLEHMKPIQPAPGAVFGLDFGIDDADEIKGHAKHPLRKVQMQWSSQDMLIWTTPKNYGIVVFEK
ncbi:MAG: hypothetical protein JXN60_02485, partial [Lentisphaerae bacterium]|nr:hypothetical protein [Lentisphaerota bacterium]